MFNCFHSDPALKVYLTRLKEDHPELYGGPGYDDISLDDEHIFVTKQSATLVSNLQPTVDSWIKSNTYLNEADEDGDDDS